MQIQPTGARVARRQVDGEEILVLLVEAASSYEETAKRLEVAKKHLFMLRPHVKHIELQIPSKMATSSSHKKLCRLARNMRIV